MPILQPSSGPILTEQPQLLLWLQTPATISAPCHQLQDKWSFPTSTASCFLFNQAAASLLLARACSPGAANLMHGGPGPNLGLLHPLHTRIKLGCPPCSKQSTITHWPSHIVARCERSGEACWADWRHPPATRVAAVVGCPPPVHCRWVQPGPPA